MMVRFNALIDAILFYCLAASLALLVGICFLQVVARYIFLSSFTWAEELSIILMLWATWGAACYAIKQSSHLRVHLIEERASQKTGLIIRLGFMSLAIPFLAVVTLASREVVAAMENQTLMSLPNIPLNTIYLSVPAGCILMIYYVLRAMAADWKTLRSIQQEER
jgi:TRAP-type C4-dicarboxylate transport system permease small subunit